MKISKTQTSKPKIIVAMSGGIDSSVAAALLKRAGFNVIGIFLKLFEGANPNNAKKVAKKLKIPFKILDLRKEFKKKVINYFLEGYKNGLTPNPCVVCNKEIKFGLLLKKALALGADYVATGHYVRLRLPDSGSQAHFSEFKKLTFSTIVKNVDREGEYRLWRAKDKEKDQSYFLWQLNQKQLRKSLFPLGDYTKKEVKKLAEKFNLSVSKTESQEICFVKTTINDFLKNYLKQKPGQIVDSKGKVLGRHQGLAFYTIGQRKGIGLPAGPYWVLDKDLKRNRLIVTKNEKDLYKKELVFKNANWISGKTPKFPLRVKVKIRYRHQLTSAILLQSKVVFDRPQRAITPGQSVVFYKGRELLGGGIIN